MITGSLLLLQKTSLTSKSLIDGLRTGIMIQFRSLLFNHTPTLTPMDHELTCLDELYKYKSSILIKDAIQYSILDKFDASINVLILNQLITSFVLPTNKINTGLILTTNSLSPKTTINKTFDVEPTSRQYLTSMFDKVSRYVRSINYRQSSIIIPLLTYLSFTTFI